MNMNIFYFSVYVFIGEHVALVDLVRALDAQKLLDSGDYIIISIDDKILKSCQVRSDALQDEIHFAREHVAFTYRRPSQNAVLEGAQIGLRLAVESDTGKGYDLEIQGFFVQKRKVAGYHAGFFERAHAAQAWGWGNTDLARELDVGDAAVGLEFLQDAPIGSIEVGTHGAMSSLPGCFGGL